MKKPALRIVLKPLQREPEARKARRLYGLSSGRTIWIDPRYSNVIYTLLHELIHVERPSWSETQVKRETTRRWKKLGWREKAELYRMLGRARLGEEDV